MRGTIIAAVANPTNDLKRPFILFSERGPYWDARAERPQLRAVAVTAAGTPREGVTAGETATMRGRAWRPV